MRITVPVLATLFAVTASQIQNPPNAYLALVGGTIYVSPCLEPMLAT